MHLLELHGPLGLQGKRKGNERRARQVYSLKRDWVRVGGSARAVLSCHFICLVRCVEFNRSGLVEGRVSVTNSVAWL